MLPDPLPPFALIPTAKQAPFQTSRGTGLGSRDQLSSGHRVLITLFVCRVFLVKIYLIQHILIIFKVFTSVTLSAGTLLYDYHH